MSILIKGLFGKDMPMPQEGYVDIRIHFKSGKLKRVTMPTGEDPFYATFDVEKLPQHGRLIDIKSVEYGKFTTVGNEYQRWWNGALESVIDNAPTVIEAEGSEE